jgi:hypothetical protein
LQKFLGDAAGVGVNRLTFSTKPGVVLARYNHAPGVQINLFVVLLQRCSVIAGTTGRLRAECSMFAKAYCKL